MAFGPFETEDQAREHCRESHPNPGGSQIQRLPEGVNALDLSADWALKARIQVAHSPEPLPYPGG